MTKSKRNIQLISSKVWKKNGNKNWNLQSKMRIFHHHLLNLKIQKKRNWDKLRNSFMSFTIGLKKKFMN